MVFLVQEHTQVEDEVLGQMTVQSAALEPEMYLVQESDITHHHCVILEQHWGVEVRFDKIVLDLMIGCFQMNLVEN